MASDNITLNSGSGGSTVRTLSDGTNEWAASVVAYATTISPGANVLQLVTSSYGLPVAQQGTWSVTANAGTNLNTSALALETGGNLATIAGAVSASKVQVNVTNSTLAVTQSGSWTVTANAGTNLNTSLLALESGGNLATLAGTVSSSKVNVNVSSGTVTAAQATASSLNATVVGTGTFTVQAQQSGTWNVGTVTTVSTVTAVTSITNALPAGTNLLGQVAQAPSIAAAFNGTTSVTPQYATFSTSSSGATTIVSGSASKKIYVLRWSVSANGNTNVNLQSHTTTTQATGVRYLTQYATGGGSFCPLGIMATASGEALDVNNSAAIAISGEVTYVQF